MIAGFPAPCIEQMSDRKNSAIPCFQDAIDEVERDHLQLTHCTP